jgi:hypothetical protein
MLIQVPVFMFPLIGVLGAPVATFVVLKITQMFVSVRNFFGVWVSVTYIVLIIESIGLSVMLFRLLARE